MQRAGFDVIVGSFKKQGTVYHAAVTAPINAKKENVLLQEFKVLLSRPDKRTVSFKIKLDDSGRWIPDKRYQVDPWIANEIGAIIESKIIKKDESTL